MNKLFFILIFLASAGQAQDLLRPFEKAEWISEVFTFRNGLNVNALTHVMQDSRGFLWISSFDGIQRFDGRDFKKFDSRAYPKIPSNRIPFAIESKFGAIFALTERDQLFMIQFDSVNVLPEINAICGNRIRNAWGMGEDSVLIASDEGVFKFGSDLKPRKVHNEASRVVFGDRYGRTYWANTEGELAVRYVDGTVERFWKDTDPVLRRIPDLRLNDKQYLATGSTLFEADENRVFVEKLPYPITALNWNQDGWVIVNTEKAGRLRWQRGKQLQPFPVGGKQTIADFYTLDRRHITVDKNEIRENNNVIWTTKFSIESVAEDHEQNLWVATNAGGLVRLYRNKIRYLGEKEGLTHANVYTIDRAPSGSIWMASFDGFLYKLDRSELHTVPFSWPKEAQYNNFVFIKVLAENRLLLGTMWEGYFVYDNGSIKQQTFNGQKPHVTSVFEHPGDSLWIGTSNGLFKSSAKTPHIISRPVANSPKAHIRIIQSLSDGTLLLGGNSPGLWRYREGAFFLVNEIGITGAVREIFVDSSASRLSGFPVVWVGTESQGVYHLQFHKDDIQVRQLTSANGLIDDVIHKIFLDQRNRFWISTNKGVMLIPRENLEAAMKQGASISGMIILDEEAGMRNREGNSGNQNAGMTDDKGRFWFPTQEGYAIFDPDLDWEPGALAPLTITGVKTNLRYHLPARRLDFDKSERDFRIIWSTPSFSLHGNMRYRFRLKGFDKDWLYQNAMGAYSYRSVPGGDYVFEVEAARPSGDWIPSESTLEIRIAKRVLEMPLFWGLLAVLFGFLVFLIVQFYRFRTQVAMEKLEKVIHERTSELQKEQALTREQARRLEKLDAARMAFLASISHEMRTPLTLVVGPVKLLLEQASDLPKMVGEQLKMVDRNADQLSSLLDNLLDLTRFESGVLELEFRLMDLNQVLRQTIRTLQPSVQPRNIRFELELDEEAVMVQGDQQRLGHVFEHVLGLLARFAAPVSVIYIRSWVEAERVHVSFVSKTSRLPENASKEVFEIFYQINDAVTGKVLDSTVGLAFAKQVLEKHNGGIVLETPADSERRIVLDLPRGLADQKSAESDALEMPDDSEISIVAEGKRTLLVVDDNDQIRKFIRLIFAKQYEIREAENGLEALENIQSTPPDLVIADVMMPVLDGVSMVKRMRTDPMMAGIPVIMVTAKDTVEDTVEGLEAGADVYLTKPFHADVLKTQVAALIKTRELLRAKVSAGQSTPLAVPSDPLLKKLYALFEEHFSNPDFGVEDIADKLFMERTQLFRKLKAAGGEGPRNLLVRYRLEKARTMISERAGTITEIAYACGFNSLSHFGQMFKAEYGVTPREWLEQQKTSS